MTDLLIEHRKQALAKPINRLKDIYVAFGNLVKKIFDEKFGTKTAWFTNKKEVATWFTAKNATIGEDLEKIVLAALRKIPNRAAHIRDPLLTFYMSA